MEGEGQLIYSKDDKKERVSYKGNFNEGKRSGKRKLIWKDGTTHDGNFENDSINGFGVYTFQKKMKENSMKVIGRSTKCQKKENMSGTMENNMRKTLKMEITKELKRRHRRLL